MKPRRELKIGQKVRFKDKFCKEQIGYVHNIHNSHILLRLCKNNDPWFIHRRQVLATFKKKDKPLIVWTIQQELDHIRNPHSSQSGIFYGVPTPETSANGKYHAPVPLRPLTKREREKWGV